MCDASVMPAGRHSVAGYASLLVREVWFARVCVCGRKEKVKTGRAYNEKIHIHRREMK